MTDFGEPLVVREVLVPSELEPGGFLAEVEIASVCGTDVHLWDGSMREYAPISLPVILGHEVVGRIVDPPEGRDHDSVGQRVRPGDRIVWTHGSCGNCHACRVLKESAMCERRRRYMFDSCEEYPFLVGGFAEFVYVFPTSGWVRIPDGVKSEWASAASCALRTVIHAFDRLGSLAHWQTVVVQGAGPLGLFTVAVARARGAGRIIVVGGPQARLDIAHAFGADESVSIENHPRPEDRVARIKDLTGGHGAEVVIEVSGATSALAEGMQMARKSGRYLVVGQVGSHTVSVDPSMLTKKQLTLIGSLSGDVGDYWSALRFLEQYRDRFDFDRLFSGRYGLDEVTLAFDRMRRMEEIKPLIVPHAAGRQTESTDGPFR